MKFKQHRLIFFALAIAVIFSCAGIFTAFATNEFLKNEDGSPESALPEVQIYAYNLSFQDNIYIKYAVETRNAESPAVQLLIWTEPQASLAEYTEEKAAKVLNPSGTETVNGTEVTVFTYRDLAAKQMTDTVYAQARMTVGGETYASEIVKYSILQYAYNMLGYTDEGTETQTLKNLLNISLEYGAAAQLHFGYRTDDLANVVHTQIVLNNGTLPDGFDKGLYVPGTALTLTANEPEDGFVFVGWTDESGTVVSTEKLFSLTVPEPQKDEWGDLHPVTGSGTDDGFGELHATTGTETVEITNVTKTYTAVYEQVNGYSQGLEYVSNGDGTCYVSGIGTCTDTDIVIPTTSPDVDIVTSIGDSAFYNCSSLTSITIPESVTSIGNSAFWDCSSLMSINIPDGVTSISDGAFHSCNSLTSINIPKGVTSICDCAFWGCSSLTSITIPESVTSIGNYAFYICSSLTGIVIPKGVTSIDDRAFERCSSLTSLVIPEGVTSIGYSAFSGCSNLTSIVIPESVTSIGTHAFYECYSLYKVVNKSDLIFTIGSTDYGYVTSYSKILEDKAGEKTYKDGNVEYIEIDTNFLFEKENDLYTLIAYTGQDETVTLPLSIDGYSYTIYEMRGVRNVIIPNGISGIVIGAFSGCSSLTSIVIPEGITSFYGAFSGCSNLTSIVIPESVSSIGDATFSGCSSLTSIVIPERVTSIGRDAFYKCSNLTSIIFNGTKEQWDAIEKGSDWDSNTGNYTISFRPAVIYSQGLAYTSNGDGTCYVSGIGTCTDTDIVIPPISPDGDIVTNIGYRTFYFCSSLTNIVIPEGVMSIGDSAFWGCSSLTSIVIPESVTSISGSAFSYCSSLTNITVAPRNTVYHIAGICLIETATKILVRGCNTSNIPADGSVTSIGDYAFCGCRSLTSIFIPGGVTSIGMDAFSGCSSLTSIVIPESVTSIGAAVFAGCSGLTSIVIPESVTSIGMSAFASCSNLTSVVIPKDVTSIGGSTFQYCNNLTSIVIPEGVRSIGSSAFYRCTSLTSIVIPQSVTSIGMSAFSGCSSLTSIVIPGGVTSIGMFAFSGCSSLTSIVILEGVMNIGDSAFKECGSLTSIVIPESVTSIGYYSFSGCINLTDITFNGTMEQWNAITKGTNWNVNTAAYTIHCTDGDISK